jgi:hypothetical protein
VACGDPKASEAIAAHPGITGVATLSSTIAVSPMPRQPPVCTGAKLATGVAAAVALDQFTLRLKLRDVYWEHTRAERVSKALFGALLAIGLLAILSRIANLKGACMSSVSYFCQRNHHISAI